MSDVDALVRKIWEEHRLFRKVCKNANLKSKKTVWQLYSNYRDSNKGKLWKAEFLNQCKHRCPECNKRLTEDKITIDHKLPRRKYPWLAWDISNLWVLCEDCNNAKKDKDWSEYVNAVRQYRGEAAYKRVKKYSPC